MPRSGNNCHGQTSHGFFVLPNNRESIFHIHPDGYENYSEYDVDEWSREILYVYKEKHADSEEWLSEFIQVRQHDEKKILYEQGHGHWERTFYFEDSTLYTYDESDNLISSCGGSHGENKEMGEKIFTNRFVKVN